MHLHHTHFYAFQMRQVVIVVDDIHKHHKKSSSGDIGTQSLTFEDGTVFNLQCKGALMDFSTTKPTQNEIEQLPIY